MTAPRQRAVLETSFWTVGFKVGLIGYVLGVFEVVVPAAVEQEILQPDRVYPDRLYPDTALFQQLRPLLSNPPMAEPPPLPMFGGGEAAAIPLAQELQAALLVNDRRPAAFARNLGVAVVTVPDMIVILRSRELVPDHMARAMLAASQQHGTSPQLVSAAAALSSLLDQ
jgi:predicted nucleic acid-binding protein